MANRNTRHSDQMLWTAAEDAKLIALRKAKASPEDMRLALRPRSQTSIERRARRLVEQGLLEPRAEPAKKNGHTTLQNARQGYGLAKKGSTLPTLASLLPE